jgi:outer membrane receptor for ferrienterochelin and colicins
MVVVFILLGLPVLMMSFAPSRVLADDTPAYQSGAEGQAAEAADEADALDALFRVDPVVVTGRRSEQPLGDAPVAVEVIDRAQIVSSGARDAAQVLSTVAGVQIDSSFRGDALRLQGLDPQHTLVLVDGERLVGARDGALDLTRFFAADIERIEIVRGPASAIYGSDAMAGVVNIITRPAEEKLGGEALGRYGATRGTPRLIEDVGHHGDVWVSGGGGGKAMRTRASASYRKQADFDLSPRTLATTGSELESYGGLLRLDWLPRAQVRVPLLARVQRRDQRGIDESGSGAVYDRTQRSDELSVSLLPRFQLNDRGSLGLSASYANIRSQYARDQRGDDDGDTYEDAREHLATLRGQHDVSLGSRVLLTAGLELLGQRFRSPRLSKVGERGRISPYAQADITLSDQPRVYSALVPSVRVDVDSQYGVNVAPRLAVRVDPASGLVVRAAAGRGFRAPSFTELLLNFENPSANYRVSGNSKLDPESSIGSNVSAELSRVRWFVATLNLYRNDVRDLIDTALVAVEGGERRFAYVNVKRARTQGVEVSWLTRPASLLQLDLTYALTHARDLTEKRALPGRSLHRGSARLLVGANGRPWSVSLRTVLVGKSRFYTEDESGVGQAYERKAYATLDARAAYRVGFVEPFVSGENLSNAGNADLTLRPLSVFAGLTLFSDPQTE